MLPELKALLTFASADADLQAFQCLVVDEDALNKASVVNRVKTFTFIKRLYGLSLDLATFREFRRLSLLIPGDFPNLVSSLAFARDPLLRSCADMVLDTPIGKPLAREDFEAWIREFAPGRYSQSMYISFSHNLYASFFQLGYLSEASGKSRLRRRRDVRPASVAYAAFLDWLTGLNGLNLLTGQFSKSLELSKDDHLNSLSSAGQLGLMRVAHAGGVLQLDFSAWLRPGESRLSLQLTP